MSAPASAPAAEHTGVHAAPSSPPHLAPIGGGWALWRCVFLRSAGFPIQQVLDLAAPECAAAADRLLDALDTQCAVRDKAVEVLRTLSDASPVPAGHRLRAAARDILRGRSPESTGLADEAARAIGRYERAQFAAATAWTEFATAYDDARRVSADAIRRIACDPRFNEAVIWQNRHGFHTAVRPLAEDRPVSPGQKERRAALVVSYLQRYCAKNDTIGFFGPVGIARWVDDGTPLAVRPGSSLLDRRRLFFEVWGIDAFGRALAEKYNLPKQLDVPVCAHPEQWLHNELLAAGTGEHRTACLEALRDFETQARGLAVVHGDPIALDVAMDRLERWFTEATGRAATQGHGRMYAARTLVYEDARRNVTVTLGPELLAAVAPALRTVLHVTRAFAVSFARAYRGAFDAAYERLERTGTGSVDALAFWAAVQPQVFGAGMQVARRVFADFQPRWCDALGPIKVPSDLRIKSDALRRRLDQLFPDGAAPWAGAIHHSPDLMIAAMDAAAVRRGEYEVVLGELHAGLNTVVNSCFVEQLDDPGELRDALEYDVAGVRVVPVLPKHSPRESARTHDAVRCRGDISVSFDGGPAADPRTISLASCRVTRGANRSLSVTEPGGRTFDVLDFFAGYLCRVLARTFHLGLPGAHTPRVTIDRLVVSRETWRVQTNACPLIDTKGSDLYIAARTWKKALGLPRFVFVRTPLEIKPVFIDFDSPALIDLLGRTMRRAAESSEPTTITEMLPLPSQTWLVDADGHHYTSELRVVAVDLKAHREMRAREAGSPR